MKFSSIFKSNRLISTLIFILILLTEHKTLQQQQQQQNSTLIKAGPINQVEIPINNEFIEYFIEQEKTVTNQTEYLSLLLKSDQEASGYQIQVEIDIPGPLDFNKCIVSIVYPNDTNSICIESYKEILESNVVLKINRNKLDKSFKIRARLVISGCNEKTQLRTIVYKPNMPNIYHVSNNDCIYVISNQNASFMPNLTIVKFPKNQECTTLVKISSTDRPNDIIGVPQAVFSQLETIEQFDSSIYLAHRHTILRLANCYENLEPIEIKLQYLKRSSLSAPLNFKDVQINSTELLGSSKLNYIVYEVNNAKLNAKISCSLRKFETRSQFGDLCASKLIIYGVTEFNNLIWYNHSCNSIGIIEQPIEFKDIKRLFIQFNIKERSDLTLDYMIRLDNVLIDVNITSSNSNSLSKKYTKRSGFYSSRIKREDLTNRQMDVEIQTPKGTQIIFNLNEFNTNINRVIPLSRVPCRLQGKNACGVTSAEKTNDCNDYVLVKINKSTSRINSLYEENSNPKICNSIQQPLTFYSYTNSLHITFSFSSIYSSGDKPIISFNYTSQKICDEISTKLSDVIKYDSSKSDAHLRESCVKQISLPKDHRIILYRTYWKLNEKGYTVRENPENKEYNLKSKCLNSDSLILREYSKELSQYSLIEADESYFCMDNPLNVYLTKTNNLYLTLQSGYSNRSRPLVFEANYFGYKYEYDEFDQNLSIDFSKLIPQDVTNSNPTSFSLRIKVPDDKYLQPVISDCITSLNNGKIYFKSGAHEYLFKIACGDLTFTTGSMNSEIIIDFRDVQLTQLRDSGVKFNISYTTLPRVMHDLAGEFQSNDFKHFYASSRSEIATYQWTIDIDSSYFIKLNIENLTNKESIDRLKISDDRIDLYELQQLDQNKSYLFSSNKLIITLEYKKRGKTESLPFVKFSYVAQPKIIQIEEDKMSQINLENVLVKDNLDWLITAPKEYNILAKLKSYEGKGQLKFSLLNDGYKPAGSYHFNLNQNDANQLTRATSFVISKSNQIRIQYFPSDVIDNFSLVYSSVKNVLTQSFGTIKPYFNDFVKDEMSNSEIVVSKLTDQRWSIKAPYGKQIKLFVNKIDLYDEEPCFKASINIYEENRSNLISLCGNQVNSAINLQSGHLIKSETNELLVKFVTQDLDEVVYSIDQNNNPQPYEGFELLYLFDEQPGDCYFRQKYSDCNYTSIGSSGWLTEKLDLEMDKNDFATICFNCYLKSQLPLQTSESEQSSSILITPMIQKSKEYLKFNYKLSKPSKLMIKIVYDQDYESEKQMIKRSTLLSILTTTENRWETAMIKIGKLFYNYRVVFSLEQQDIDEISSEPITVGLDDVQLFEKDLECESNEFPDTCFISNQKKRELTDLVPVDKSNQDIKFCKQTVMPCSYNKCALNSVCINQAGEENSYKCQCGFGYTGQFCEIKIDPCQPQLNNCSINSQCIRSNPTDVINNHDSTHMSYECKCNLNYHGKFCEHNYNPCKRASNPCNQFNGQGVCHDAATPEQPDKFTCTCSSLYTGEQCETKLEMQCSNNEVCRKFDKNANCVQFDDDTFVCLCSPGFEGDLCDNINDCQDSVCLNNGTCIDGINSFQCKCDEKYIGTYCEEAKICSECNQNGTIYCNKNTSECICRDTHFGKHCENKHDICANNPCLNGKCFSNQTDYYCICPDGFKGKNCDQSETVCDKGHCLNEAQCVLDSNSTDLYTCKCAPNFSGKFCEHFNDPCNSNPCQNSGTCYGHKSSFKCGCPLDFTGKNCEEPIDNCNNHNCASGSTCLSMLNTYICLCPEGRIGQYCEQSVDKCANNQCQNGKCVPNYMSVPNYSCECLPGYEGQYCEKKIKRCSPGSNPCFNDGVCIDLLYKYECKCPQIYSISNCNKTEYCSLEETKCVPMNTARCEAYPGGKKCVCAPRFTGSKCEQMIDICEFEKPCRSGVCQLVNGTDYQCVNCAPGFTGKQCNQMINICESNPCQNNATCLTKPNGYFCKCPDGYLGKNCEQRIEIECLHHKCQHNSVCEPIKQSSSGNGYKCKCDKNYEGLYCEKKVDLCKNVVCDYGYCVDGKCECDTRFPYCKKNSDCHKKLFICENGGTCIDVIRDSSTIPQCLCPPGLVGPNCNESYYCNSPLGAEVCGGQNQCKVFNKNYVCNCSHPIVGHGCKKNISDHYPIYLGQLKEERSNKVREVCRFGVSSQSKIFIGIVIVFILMFLMVGFLIGHRMIVSFKKKYIPNFMKRNNNSISSADELITKSMIKGPMMYNEAKTPVSSYACISRNDINKSGFSIPRPSVRLENKTFQ